MKTVVVADTGPVHYLFLIGEIELLPTLFGRIHIPREVYNELCHVGAPAAVRNWALAAPEWMVVRDVSSIREPDSAGLDAGELAAIALAESIQADLLLIDDRKAVRAAMDKGLAVIGTLGVIRRAGEQQLVDVRAAVERLKATNFRYRPAMLAELIDGFGAKQ